MSFSRPSHSSSSQDQTEHATGHDNSQHAAEFDSEHSSFWNPFQTTPTSTIPHLIDNPTATNPPSMHSEQIHNLPPTQLDEWADYSVGARPSSALSAFYAPPTHDSLFLYESAHLGGGLPPPDAQRLSGIIEHAQSMNLALPWLGGTADMHETNVLSIPMSNPLVRHPFHPHYHATFPGSQSTLEGNPGDNSFLQLGQNMFTTTGSASPVDPTQIRSDLVEEELYGSDNPVEAEVAVRQVKQKKVKMHQCPICQKQFPRPSGLKLHMTTHNNEKRTSAFFLRFLEVEYKTHLTASSKMNTAFVCTFPGCTRRFNVRSNAKRHLRTHGVSAADIAQYDPAPPPSPKEVPYIVDFTEPTVATPPDAASLADDSHRAQSGRRTDHEHEMFVEPQDSQAGGPSTRTVQRRRPPSYKVRWLPTSATTRLKASSRYGVGEQPEPWKGKEVANAMDDGDSPTDSEEPEGASDDPDEEEEMLRQAVAASRFDRGPPPNAGSSSGAASSSSTSGKEFSFPIF
ncbi:hypothetical protein D9613_010122 [Agrocybe pediades]|uniref:C2H2-type domain-containing protein n=1 Tax=Agrocybe pediades TaxID=84607 RepID=A0A8H4VSX6_9AGAR|nr:hypothetical protein D9613_010122 [Agrocybe pediades]